MPIVNKLLGLATVGGTVANVTFLHRFLAGVTGVVALTVISAFLFCILLAGGFCAAYLGLVHYGLDPYAAALTMGILLLLFTLVAIGLTALRLNRLRELPYYSLQRDMPQLSHVTSAAHAFIDGLLNPRASRRD